MVRSDLSAGPAYPANFGVHRDYDSVFPLFPDSSHKISIERMILTQTPATTMSTIMTAVTTIVTEAIAWIGQFTAAITSNPLLLAFVVVSFVGLGVGLIRRIIHA